MQLGRYGEKCEQTNRSNFAKKFDFLEFNLDFLKNCISNDCVIAFDPNLYLNQANTLSELETIGLELPNQLKEELI